MKRSFTLFISIAALFAALGAFFIFTSRQKTQKIAPEEPKSSVKEQIRINNAKIVPEKEITLSFTFPGRIEKIFSEEGASLKQGEAIIKLETESLELIRSQAEAAVVQAKNELDKVRSGTRPEEIAIFERRTSAAETSLKNSRNNVLESLRNSFEVSDSAIRNNVDRLFLGGDTSSPSLQFTPHHGSATSFESDRKRIEQMLDTWKDDIDELHSTDDNEIKLSILKYKKRLRSIRNFIDDISAATNSLSDADGIDAETLSAWKEGISSARLLVADASSLVAGNEGSYRDSAKNALISSDVLQLYRSGSRTQDIAIAQAALDTATQSLAQADDSLEQATLRCPTEGLMITKIYLHESESLPAYQPAVILATKSLRIDTDVPEEDIGSIQIDKPVTFRFDAFPEKNLSGKIQRIKEKEILKDANIYFRVESEFVNQPHGDFRSGMTGTLIIDP